MTRSELDGYINALARLNGKKSPSAGTTKTTRSVKSKRQKKTRRI